MVLAKNICLSVLMAKETYAMQKRPEVIAEGADQEHLSLRPLHRQPVRSRITHLMRMQNMFSYNRKCSPCVRVELT